MDIWDADFIVSGEYVPTAKLAGEQLAVGIEQQKQQMQEQQEMVDEDVEYEEEGEEEPLEKSIPRHKRKFKGRTGGITPNWHDKAPNEERDIDEYAEARAKKNELTLSKSWIESLSYQGFTSPVIKEITSDMSKMWFSQNDIDYVANLSPTGVTHIEKAVFTDPKKFSRKNNKQEKNITKKLADVDTGINILKD